MTGSRRGAALLEAIVALAILATVGAAAAGMASDSLRAVEHVREAELEVRRAVQFMTAVALWPREDLDRHLGRSAQGPWDLVIDRRTPTFYRIALVNRTTRRLVLATAIVRTLEQP